MLRTLLSAKRLPADAAIYLFSEGKPSDFPELEQFGNLQYCLDMDAFHSFVHMAHADILISSKSSFSYKPALISKGIKIVPDGFWHKYPQTADFIVAGEEGDFDLKKLETTMSQKTMIL